ncbi:beta-phosphoglucomutase [Coprobacillus sp. AF09-1A]|nr:beta-phosphoglucomutase [Coprobacillus sp. AF09-1A]
MKKYEAIIFDLDGVIVSTDEYHYLAWKELACLYEIPFNRDINKRLRGVSRMESLNIILENSYKEFTNDEKEKMAEQKNNIYKEFILKMSETNLPKNIKDTLNILKKKGFYLAIGSSSQNTKTILKQIHLDHFFDAISDGTNIHYSKPHPEVFMNAADILKLDYQKCLVVEDAEAGCIAGKSAGMDVAAIGSAYGCPYANYHLNTFANLLDILA